MSEPSTPSPERSPPPRAFAQGVGTVFQFTGVSLFLISFFVCCGSGLLSRDTATQSDLNQIGWKLGADRIVYSAQRALAISLPCAVFFGMALAGVGLGLQAQNRRAAPLGVLLTGTAAGFWLVQTIFFLSISSWGLLLLSLLMSLIFSGLLLLAIAAQRDMLANPPPAGMEVLPTDYKVPYSHMHQDPPEIRLARELDQRRQRLAVQQKELELLEEKLKRKLQQKDG